jgi:hypothetical protein
MDYTNIFWLRRSMYSHIVTFLVTLDGYWIDNCIYWITVYTLQYNTVHFTAVFPLGRVFSRLGPGPPADPTILRRLNYSTLLSTLQPSTVCSSLLSECLPSSLSEIYDLWTDCREDTAFGIVGCLAITRKRVPSGLGLARYQATSTPRRARHSIILS